MIATPSTKKTSRKKTKRTVIHSTTVAVRNRPLSSLTDEQLIRTALDTLPASHQLAQELLLEGHIHRWINAVSALPGGEQPTRLDLRHQPDPADHPRLFVTGDYLFDSTLNGVLDSAECVASWIVAELENRPLPNR